MVLVEERYGSGKLLDNCVDIIVHLHNFSN